MTVALLLIDMQDGLTPIAHEIDRVVGNLRLVLDGARAAGAPVVHVQHHEPDERGLFHGAPAWRIVKHLAPAPGEWVIDKTASDAFFNTPLAERLRAAGVTHLVIGGMQTEYCVDATCRRALSEGFNVTLIADGHTTQDSALPAATIIAHHNALLRNLAHPERRLRTRAAAAVLWTDEAAA